MRNPLKIDCARTESKTLVYYCNWQCRQAAYQTRRHIYLLTDIIDLKVLLNLSTLPVIMGYMLPKLCGIHCFCIEIWQICCQVGPGQIQSPYLIEFGWYNPTSKNRLQGLYYFFFCCFFEWEGPDILCTAINHHQNVGKVTILPNYTMIATGFPRLVHHNCVNLPVLIGACRDQWLDHCLWRLTITLKLQVGTAHEISKVPSQDLIN